MTELFAKAVFWIFFVIVAYVYVGYPLLLSLIRATRGARNISRDSVERRVTLMISAFNEEGVIGAKIKNCLSLDYPRDRRQIIVISDASSDRTDDIVAEFSSQGVELLRMPDRGGKTIGLNEAVTRATGDIIVFSDANAMYAPDVLRMLVRNFADPAVGAAVGESTYTNAEVQSERSEGLYWRYETAIKRMESQIGSVVGGDGAIYAIRRQLYLPMPADALSDFVNPLQIVKSGHRCVYEPAARSSERAAGDFGKEFRRKVRIVNRAWRAMLGMNGLLNPLRHGLFSIMLISHKLLRWLVPVVLMGLFVANTVLLNAGHLYRAAMTGQVIFYLLASIGYVLRRRNSIPAFFAIPFYFCLVNLASVRGIIDAFRGRTYTTWTTARTPGR